MALPPKISLKAPFNGFTGAPAQRHQQHQAPLARRGQRASAGVPLHRLHHLRHQTNAGNNAGKQGGGAGAGVLGQHGQCQSVCQHRCQVRVFCFHIPRVIELNFCSNYFWNIQLVAIICRIQYLNNSS